MIQGGVLMSYPVPIACTLSSAALSERAEEMRLVGESGLASAVRDGASAVLRFSGGPELHERLKAIVAAEAECCPFLDLDLSDGKEALELSVRGPSEAEEIVRAMVEAFSALLPTPRGREC